MPRPPWPSTGDRPGSYDDWLLETRSELQRECADLCAAERHPGAHWNLAGAVDAARRRIELQRWRRSGTGP